MYINEVSRKKNNKHNQNMTECKLISNVAIIMCRYDVIGK